MKAIINTKLILEDSIIFDGVITFADGVIVQLGKASEVEIPEGAEIIDAGGKYTAPGLIDIHNPTPRTVDAMMKLDLPAGVEIEIKLNN